MIPLLRSRLLVALITFAGLLAAAAPLAHADEPALDPVVRDVVRMLDEGVEPALVLRWLETSDLRPGPLAAQDLIALSRAGAPEGLVQRLIDTAGQPPAGSPTPTPAAGACCLVDFEIVYRAAERLEGEQEAEGMDLYVYLDGHPLALLESMPDLGGPGPFKARMRLSPGRHVLRLLRERHTQRRSGRWRHHSRVCPDVIAFEITPGAAWAVDLSWSESSLSTTPPLDWRLTRDGVTVAEQHDTGTDKDDWPALCEEPDDRNCVRWEELWPADLSVPTRAEVRAELERRGYRPFGD